MSDVDFDQLLFNELREHVFGLGLISLRYNLFESALRFILFNYVEYPVLDLLYDRTSNEQRAHAIRTIARVNESDPETIDHVDYLLTYFSICAENRNILMHSTQSFTEAGSASLLTLEKRVKAGGKNLYPLDLPLLKRVANDMNTGVSYLIEVDNLIQKRPAGILLPRAFLQKPPLPDKLNPHQPLVNLL
jgi:hypothetical protein